jgi:hypothetical protein
MSIRRVPGCDFAREPADESNDALDQLTPIARAPTSINQPAARVH